MALNDFIMDPKDAKRILFGTSGKLNPTEFAQGLVAIVAISIAFNILSLLPGVGALFALVGIVVALGLIYCWVSIFSKRFHDAGQSGWMTLAAILVAIVLSVVIGMILNPVFGVSMSMQGGMMEVYTANRVLASILTNVIVNGLIGYYMYRLKPAAA